MKVLVTGATGFVGQALLKHLEEKGHEIVILTRNVRTARVRAPVFCEIHQCDLSVEVPKEAVFEGVEAVIHLAGENIAEGRWTTKRKNKILLSRKNSTANLIRAMEGLKLKPRAFVSASAIGYYGNRSEERLNEESSQGSGFLPQVCRIWEDEAKRASTLGIRTTIYRIGVVLGYDGGAIQKMWAPFKLGFGGRLGSGRQWMSWIHVTDLARALVYAIEYPLMEGCFNAVSPEPVTNNAFTRQFAKTLDQPAPFPVPTPALKMILGEMSQILLHSQWVSTNQMELYGFRYQYPSLVSALKEICNHQYHSLQFAQWHPAASKKIFHFFEYPENIEKVTPPSLRLKYEGPRKKAITMGERIPLRFSLKGLPMKWISKIKTWDPGNLFIDTQTEGPFSLWKHTHQFERKNGGTLVRDQIEYRLPLGVLGDWVAGARVKKFLEKTLSYRMEKMAIFLK